MQLLQNVHQCGSHIEFMNQSAVKSLKKYEKVNYICPKYVKVIYGD